MSSGSVSTDVSYTNMTELPAKMRHWTEKHVESWLKTTDLTEDEMKILVDDQVNGNTLEQMEVWMFEVMGFNKQRAELFYSYLQTWTDP